MTTQDLFSSLTQLGLLTPSAIVLFYISWNLKNKIPQIEDRFEKKLADIEDRFERKLSVIEDRFEKLIDKLLERL